mgnify:CR=1 FL=1
MSNVLFANTARLSHFIIRQDRWRISLWVIGITLATLSVPLAFLELYGSEEQRAVMALTMENPAMIAMVGTADLTNYTLGVMTAHQMLLLTSVVVGLMNILLVARHTRGDEEDGRLEMIRSLPVGRLANVHATIIIYIAVNVLLAVICGIGLYALSIDSMNLEGSLLYGATLGATGIFFAGITTLFAQLSDNARGTIGLSITFLLVAYMLRAIGDVSDETWSWVSPLGWVTKTEAYGANQWGWIGLLVGGALLLFIATYYLNARRDVGAGLLPSKPGKEHASSFLQSPIGISFRLQRVGFISWAIGMFILGASYGSVLGDLDSFFEGNELLEQMIASEDSSSAAEQFIPIIMMVMAIIATIPPIISMNKLIAEERKNRIELLLAKPISRTRLMASFLVVAVLSSFIMLSLAAIGLWAAGTAVMEEPINFVEYYQMGIVYYPAVLSVLGLTVCMIGWLPHFTSVVWLYVVYSFVVVYLGELFQFSDLIVKLSPFGHIPQIPLEDISWYPIIMLCVISVFLTLLGFVGYNKRDMQG